MLRKWHVPIATACCSEELSEDLEDIPTWEEINPVGVGNVKLDKQAEQIQKLLGEYSRVFQDVHTLQNIISEQTMQFRSNFYHIVSIAKP